MNTKLLATLLFIGICSASVSAQMSAIEIIGKTNVNTFKCINKDVGSININFNRINAQNLPEIIVPVKDFDCHNRIMTRDLQSTVKMEEFPNFRIKFLSLSQVSTGNYRANIEVRMMNRVKSYLVDFLLSSGTLYGKKGIKFSDFAISPPRRMGGMIVVNDNLNLSFSLKVN